MLTNTTTIPDHAEALQPWNFKAGALYVNMLAYDGVDPGVCLIHILKNAYINRRDGVKFHHTGGKDKLRRSFADQMHPGQEYPYSGDLRHSVHLDGYSLRASFIQFNQDMHWSATINRKLGPGILVRQSFPEIIVASLAGRRLKEVIDHPIIDKRHLIKQAYSDQRGTVILFEDVEIQLAKHLSI